MSGLRALVLAGLLVVAGCAAPAIDRPDSSEGDRVTVASEGGADRNFSDPSSDRLGWEAGYWYDEPVDVNQSDGLSDAEMEAFVGRAMARVEVLRGKEFRREVPVEVLSREEYGARSAGGGQSPGNFDEWNNQVWEALFVTGESTDSQGEIGETRDRAVAGFYSPANGEIRIVTDAPESPVIDNRTLVHELVHALQDQHYDLTDSTYAARTQDAQLAVDGLIEGDASYVAAQYARRCGGEWQCVDSPVAGGGAGAGGGGSGPNLGILLTVYQPYADGPQYVASLRERGGWEAVDEAFEGPPVSSEQTIHVTDEAPEPIDYDDAARDGWRLFPDQGVEGSDTVGEASIYVMFWYQAYQHDADTVDPRSLFRTDGPYDEYNYDAPPSAGWANDRLFPYRNATDSGTDYGYVWTTRWDTERDAREFRNAYLAILDAHGAEERADGVHVIEDGEFADAFRIVRRGERVVIVNGPTPDDVADLRPGLAEE